MPAVQNARVSKVLIVGAGVCGLGTALLLARDGHDITILEKDCTAWPQSAATAWAQWTRKGVAQFRQPHNFMPGMRLLLEAELPDVQEAIIAAGAARFDLLHPFPRWISDTADHPVDDKLWTYAIRRPAGEWVFLDSARNDPRIRLRQGATVSGLKTGASSAKGVPHVTGVRLSNGEELAADLVVDCSGRGSRGTAWLRDIGVDVPEESSTGGYFTYITRFFEGTEPERVAPVLSELGSISILCLPGERDSWSVTVFASSDDPLTRRLRDEEVFMRVVRAHPLHAHWLDGTPVSEVLAMGGVVDRYRRLATDAGPVVTGFVAIADAWACTNPSAGRGITVGMLHARHLRDCIRAFGTDPLQLAVHFDEVTERELRPWYEAQIASDRVRFEAMEAQRSGEKIQVPKDPLTQDLFLLRTGMLGDGELFRLGLEYIATLAPAQQIMDRPGVRQRMQEAVTELMKHPPPPIPGPTREELLTLAS